MNKILSYGLIALAAVVSIQCARHRTPEAEVRRFIADSWPLTVRSNPADEDTLIGLPYPYTVPSVSGMFQEMYYWDTFFTNEGLIADGFAGQARNNTDNLLAMVERFGYVPNGSRTWYLNRSQPPYLCLMVERIYRTTGDMAWLEKAFATLRREYDFWMRERMTPAGLNRYSSHAEEPLLREFVATASTRLGRNFADAQTDDEVLTAGRHLAAEAESGWDFTPRFEHRCEDFCPIDLNANLCIYEQCFARWSRMFGDECQAAEWERKARSRSEKIEALCADEDGLYYDYDFVNGRRSTVVSGAIFNLLVAGIVPSGKVRSTAVKALEHLEYEHGISTCADDSYDCVCQWSYPNAWAPVTWLAVRGLAACGMTDDARRIAGKYIDATVSIFASTGNLWEKYNVRTGGIDVNSEYQMPSMLGWSAGVFICLDEWMHGRFDMEYNYTE